MKERPARRGHPRLIIGLLLLALVIAVIDQLSKYLAEDRLTPGVVVPLVGDYLGLQLIYNPGAAFSLATGMTWVLTVIMVVVIVVVLRVARRLRSTAWTVALGMLLGGALGNLYDRLLRDPGFGRGHVVDFINYNGWFVGNIADIAIVAAAVLIALLALVGIEVDGTRSGGPEPAATPDEAAEEGSGEEYSPQLPSASGEAADIASWAAGAPAVATSGSGDPAPGARPAGEAEDRPSRAVDPEQDTGAVDEPAPAAGDGPAWGPVRTRAPEPAGAERPEPATAPEEGPAAAPPPPRPPRRPSRREIRLAERDKNG